VGLHPKTYRFASTRPDDGVLRTRLKELASQRRRFGYRRLGLLLARPRGPDQSQEALVEIGFRQHENFVAGLNAKLAQNITVAELFDQRGQRKGLRVPGNSADAVRAVNASLNAKFQMAVDELNARFRQADCQLHYHNGFIQISEDQTVALEIETPFWRLLAQQKWHNVDHDMKEAIDLRDTGGRDPVFYAARSLESTIKIISDEKQLTTDKEKGAHNYIDNLMGARR
jgi:hypothetical protein